MGQPVAYAAWPLCPCSHQQLHLPPHSPSSLSSRYVEPSFRCIRAFFKHSGTNSSFCLYLSCSISQSHAPNQGHCTSAHPAVFNLKQLLLQTSPLPLLFTHPARSSTAHCPFSRECFRYVNVMLI